jgi:hypothetical protein
MGSYDGRLSHGNAGLKFDDEPARSARHNGADWIQITWAPEEEDQIRVLSEQEEDFEVLHASYRIRISGAHNNASKQAV